jgi:hypothetical protein
MSYLDSGFNQNLIRTRENPLQIDSNNIEEVIRDGSISINSLALRSDNIKDFMIDELSVGKLLTGTLTAVTNIGDSSIQLDGENKEIKIYDDSSPAKVSIYMKGGSA